ncbi:MAG: hypothetical protein HYS44_02355 [Candidatus Niyogibacteria bacterium]|nr:hypothetical protein [Candidatus Niyogibacteria bacterium]
MKNVIHRLLCGALLILFLGAIAWKVIPPLFVSTNEVVAIEDVSFRSPMADLRGTTRLFRFQIVIGNSTRWIQVPLGQVKIVAREDGQNVTTISGTRYKRNTDEWLEATVLVPPEDLKMWEERMRFFNPDFPVRIDPELDLR